MRKKFYLAALIVLTIASIASASFLTGHRQALKRPSTLSKCPTELTVTADRSSQRLHPAKVVVKPWDGRHNVYGLFVVPTGVVPHEFFAVKVDDNTTYCGTFDYASAEQAEGIVTKPGEQVVIGYLRTRTTLWLMSRGKRSELKQPENWSLPIEKVGTGS